MVHAVSNNSETPSDTVVVGAPEAANSAWARAPVNINPLRLVLITPARNEAAFIEQTIKSVINQSIRPIKWVIVSDGSTDGTDEIVSKYCDRYSWMEAVFLPPRTERHFP